MIAFLFPFKPNILDYMNNFSLLYFELFLLLLLLRSLISSHSSMLALVMLQLQNLIFGVFSEKASLVK